MLYRFAGTLGLDTSEGSESLQEFKDKDQVSDFARDAMQWCVANGMISGSGKGDAMYIQILIIDSDFENAKRMKYSLQSLFIKTYYTTIVTEGIRHLVHYPVHLVIMDVSSGEADGFQSLKKVRELTTVPILAISVNGDSDHIVRVLTLADDYLQKPIDVNVCAAKIQALLRRNTRTEIPFDALPILTEDNKLLIDPQRRSVVLMDVEIVLPRKQFELLYLLAGNAGRVFTREQLYEKVWGEVFMGNDNTLNCQMRSLRSSLKAVPNAPEYLHTMRGVGYYFDIK